MYSFSEIAITNLHKRHGPKQIYSFIVLETRSPKSKCHVPFKHSGE